MGYTVTVTDVCAHCLTTDTNPPQQSDGRSRLCRGHRDAARRYWDAVRQARSRARKAGVQPPTPQAYEPKPLQSDVAITGVLLTKEDLAELAGVAYQLFSVNAALGKAQRGESPEALKSAVNEALDVGFLAAKVVEGIPGVMDLRAVAAAGAQANR